MFKIGKATHDVFTLSLGGMTAIAGFAAAPAIAHDRLHQVREECVGEDRDKKRHLWTPMQYQVATT